MANELNFDELDQAVSQYMERKSAPEAKPESQAVTPVDTSVPVLVGARLAPTPRVAVPEPLKPVDGNVPTPSAPSQSAGTVVSRPAVTIPTRRAISPRPVPKTTFHDVTAPVRHSPVKPLTKLEPKTASEPSPRPLGRPLPGRSASRPTLAHSAPVMDIAPVKRPSLAPLAPIATPRVQAPAPAPEAAPTETVSVDAAPAVHVVDRVTVVSDEPKPKVLGEPMPKEKEEAPVVPHTDERPLHELLAEHSGHRDPTPLAEEHRTDDSSAAPVSFAPEESLDRKDQDATTAALDDLTKKTAPAFSPADLADETSRPGAAVVEQASIPANAPSPSDEPKKTAWPSTAGLLDTGEVYANNLLSGQAAEPGNVRADVMDHHNDPVYDTTQYHTPISGAPHATSGGKVMIIIILIAILVILAGLAIYMYAF